MRKELREVDYFGDIKQCIQQASEEATFKDEDLILVFNNYKVDIYPDMTEREKGYAFEIIWNKMGSQLLRK